MNSEYGSSEPRFDHQPTIELRGTAPVPPAGLSPPWSEIYISVLI